MKAGASDIAFIDKLYEGRKSFHGELHDHADTGGTSDGGCTLEQWREGMEKLSMDFAAILDHRQVRHMYLPQWEDGVFIAGTEPAAGISDIVAVDNWLHYNMLFETPHQLEAVLEKFPEYNFTGGVEGHFEYPSFTRERFCSLIDEVKAQGGFFVNPHPKQAMISDDPLNYWFRDETGMEVFYMDMKSEETKENYRLWTELLSMGKRIWVCAGGDGHAEVSDAVLTTIYAEERKNRYYIEHLRQGDFVCGPVGIKMCIGSTKMGGQCSFKGSRLIISVGDFHKSVYNPDRKFRLDLLSDKGTVFSRQFSCEETSYFAADAEECSFYRAEIYDETENLLIAIGNPIWNT